jgi:cellulose biosynthesis protein BcsQ
MQFVRPKKLVFFNNKGVVGKTTIAYNTAVKFAHNGYKTVMVDLDPQCNLSRLALGNEFDNSLTSKTTIYEVLSGILYGGSDIDMSIPFKNIQENLFLLQGNLNLSLYEDRLSSAFTDASAGNPLGFFQTSAIDRFLTHKGLYEDVDLFIIDASPSLGLLNRAILLGSDYFITPLMPDAFSLQGIDNLGITFERWKNAWKITTQVIAKERGITTNNVLSGEGLFI